MDQQIDNREIMNEISISRIKNYLDAKMSLDEVEVFETDLKNLLIKKDELNFNIENVIDKNNAEYAELVKKLRSVYVHLLTKCN